METDEEVEEIVEKEVIKDVVQEIRVPQVKALYPFTGQGLKMAKGEVGRMINWTSSSIRRWLGSDVIYQGRGGKSDKIGYRDPYRGG